MIDYLTDLLDVVPLDLADLLNDLPAMPADIDNEGTEQ